MFRLRHAWLALAALALGLVLTPSARAVEPKLLPADTEWAFSINLKQILDSDLVKANRETLDALLKLAKANAPNDPGAEKFLEAAGFDVMKDMIGFTVAGPAGVDPDKLVMIIEGKFKADKVHAAADEFAKMAGAAVKTSMIGKVKVYEVAVDGEKTLFASLIDDKHLVASATKDTIAEVIARNTGAKKAGHKKEFRAVLDATNAKQSLNFAATGNALMTGVKNAPKIPKNDQVAGVLADIHGLSGSITVKKDVEFQLNVTAADADAAQKMAQGAQFAIGAVKAMVQNKADTDPNAQIAVDVLKTLRVTNMGPNLVFRGEMTVDVVEKIFKAVLP